ncbi:hypothetical protein GGX14DRAFT_366587 [Mycena pura]|uniref:Uncharacterized protein n=1 Tax=Mycena pura TaxID=153505 RepID=A0AAD6VHE7_9AGAR|nr:hypothetical protein GGX14DRAFT_366587 [Mycena pura]
MCRWRHVRNIYLRCGHAENLPSTEIKCESARCKFSPNHPEHCVRPHCKSTCKEHHLFPEHYNPNIDAFCSVCTRVMGGRRRRLC